MQRMGMVIGIKPEKIAYYKELHAAGWPGVLDRISKSNIRNYSIYLKEPENLLFSYFEYHGPTMQRICSDCGRPGNARMVDAYGPVPGAAFPHARKVNGGRQWKRSSITIEGP